MLLKLQLFTDVLKILQKEDGIITTYQFFIPILEMKENCCLNIITSAWKTLCNEIDTTNFQANHVFLQFLSLNLEILKHLRTDLQVFVSTLNKVSFITSYLSCGLCLARYTDLMTKYIDLDEGLSPLIAKLCTKCLFHTCLMDLALRDWFYKEGKNQAYFILYKVYLPIFHRNIHDDVNITFVRKSFLLFLKFLLFTTTTSTSEFSKWLCEMFVSLC